MSRFETCFPQEGISKELDISSRLDQTSSRGLSLPTIVLYIYIYTLYRSSLDNTARSRSDPLIAYSIETTPSELRLRPRAVKIFEPISHARSRYSYNTFLLVNMIIERRPVSQEPLSVRAEGMDWRSKEKKKSSSFFILRFLRRRNEIENGRIRNFCFPSRWRIFFTIDRSKLLDR